MLYTITFKSGAQQEFDLDEKAVAFLVEGFQAVNGGQKEPVDGTLFSGRSGFLLSEVAGFGPYVSMTEKYGNESILAQE